VERSSTSVVSAIDINTLLGTPILYMLKIAFDDSLAESCSIANISHGRPFIVGDGIETSNFLSSRIVRNEFELARDVDFGFFLCNINLLIGFRYWTVSTTVLKNFLGGADEAWMSVKMYLAVLGFVPFCVEEKIFGVEQSVDAGDMVFWA
jgi:hypothetical protein